MDNQTLKMEVFVKSLTDAEAATCESDEKQLAAIFSAGWSEETAVRFHRAMLHARSAISPAVTVEGVFEAAFQLGLSFIVSPDGGAALAKPRRGKSKSQKRGVRGV